MAQTDLSFLVKKARFHMNNRFEITKDYMLDLYLYISVLESYIIHNRETFDYELGSKVMALSTYTKEQLYDSALHSLHRTIKFLKKRG